MSIYQSMPLEEFDGTVANRFDRDYLNMVDGDTEGRPDKRKGRQLDEQSVERQGRLYVDPETLVSETGQDAQLTVDQWGLTQVGVDGYVRPEGAVENNAEAIAAELVPPVGGHIAPYRYLPVEPEPEPEEPEDDPIDPEAP